MCCSKVQCSLRLCFAVKCISTQWPAMWCQPFVYWSLDVVESGLSPTGTFPLHWTMVYNVVPLDVVPHHAEPRIGASDWSLVAQQDGWPGIWQPLCQLTKTAVYCQLYSTSRPDIILHVLTFHSSYKKCCIEAKPLWLTITIALYTFMLVVALWAQVGVLYVGYLLLNRGLLPSL